jgi:hypothetical protein
MKPEGRSSLLEEKKKDLEKHDNAISGGIQEEIVYNKLRECLTENKVKNTVVINGWKDNGSRDRTQKEFDFLIVSQPSQTIIHIEVKKTCSNKQFKSASEQLESGLQMFQETIPFPGIVKWKYIKVIYFGFAAKEPPPFQHQCLKCSQNFIIGPSTDLNLWWNELITEFIPQESASSVEDHRPQDNTYLNVLRFLLHQMHMQQNCATPGQLVQLTSQTSDKICSQDTIIFWSKEQYKTLNDLSNHRIAFTSGYGTGKTILIQTKAKDLLKTKTNKVVIVIFEAPQEETLLRNTYGKIMEKYSSAKIIGVQKKGKITLN